MVLFDETLCIRIFHLYISISTLGDGARATAVTVLVLGESLGGHLVVDVRRLHVAPSLLGLIHVVHSPLANYHLTLLKGLASLLDGLLFAYVVVDETALVQFQESTAHNAPH